MGIVVDKNKPRLLTTSFIYTLPCQLDILVYFTARDVSSTFLVDPGFCAYLMNAGKCEREPMDLLYNKEVFEDIEDKAHALIYEGEWEHVEDCRNQEDNCGDSEAGEDEREVGRRAWQED